MPMSSKGCNPMKFNISINFKCNFKKNNKIYKLVLFLIFNIIIIGPYAHGETSKSTDSDGQMPFDCVGKPWIVDDSFNQDNKASFRSAPIDCGGVSTLCRYAIGPAQVSFSWQMDVPPRIGTLAFYVDDRTVYEYNSPGWDKFSYSLPENKLYKIEWIFKKIKSYPRWAGVAHVTDIAISPQLAGSSFITSDVPSGKKCNQSNLNYPFMTSCIICPRDITNPSRLIMPNVLVEPNITVVPRIIMPNMMILPAVENVEKSPIIITNIWPLNNAILASGEKVPFKFETNMNEVKVINCTLFIDGNKKESVTKLNNSTIIVHKFEDREEGDHVWCIKCIDCFLRYNSSIMSNLSLLSKNTTTYVQINSDPSRFIYSSVQAAVDNVSAYGIVKIYGGSYEGPVEIIKPIHLIGYNYPTIHVKNCKYAVLINSSDVDIEGLNISSDSPDMSSDPDEPAAVESRGYIENIKITNNFISAPAVGIALTACDSSELKNNIIFYNRTPDRMPIPNRAIGIYLEKSDKCKILNNQINGSSNIHGFHNCMYLKDSKEVHIEGNDFIKGEVGVAWLGNISFIKTLDFMNGTNKFTEIGEHFQPDSK